MLQTNNHYALITGGSAGLGLAIANQLAVLGHNLLIVALPHSGLKDLGQQLAAAHNIQVNTFEIDLATTEGPQQVVDWCEKHNFSIKILVNNAGFGGTTRFVAAAPDWLDAMLMLNVRATVLLTRLLLPRLMAHPKSYILNISSVAAFSPLPLKGVYPASKAFIAGWSTSLRVELAAAGVVISVVYPGPMPTTPDIIQMIVSWGWLGQRTAKSPAFVAKMAVERLFLEKKTTIPGIWNDVLRRLATLVPISLRMDIGYKQMARELASKNIPTDKIHEPPLKK